VGFSGSQKL